MNNSKKCRGKVTRKNTKNSEEISAVDFVIATETVEKWITSLIIDEEGIMKVKGKIESDHNTICIELDMYQIDKTKPVKRTEWNIRASAEKWACYKSEIEKQTKKANQIIKDSKTRPRGRPTMRPNGLKAISMKNWDSGSKEHFSKSRNWGTFWVI